MTKPDQIRAEARPFGVGIAGCGPVTQAVHLPTLARLPRLFRVTNVMDVDADLATSVAARAQAVSSTSIDELLDDDAVEVLAICSPPQFHAAQAVAAMRAGKKAILCEKPLATSKEDAQEISRVSVETDVPILVGTMHLFDPAWLAAANAIGDLPARAHTIRSSIVLPPNDQFEDWASEILQRPAQSAAVNVRIAEEQASIIHSLVLSLAVHDLPFVRLFAGNDDVVVVSARFIHPQGYGITLRAGNRTAQLLGLFHRAWRPAWELDVLADETSLHIEFPPSYVHAGSASATITEGSRALTFGGYDHNGYEGEWRVLHAMASGELTNAPGLDSAVRDLNFAVAIADQAASKIRLSGEC